MEEHVLLCLKCRQRGHDVDHCDRTTWAGELDWFFSPARKALKLGTLGSDTDSKVCSRCEDLDLVTFFQTRPPWKSQAAFTDDFVESDGSNRSLGKTGTVEFWADCPVCCLLFAVTPHPSSTDQDVLLIPDWTISRLSGELGAVTMDEPEKRKYATSLLVVLRPSSLSLSARVSAHRGDALCMLEDDIRPESTLGGRRIDARDIDVKRILGWVEACKNRHDHYCLPTPTEELKEIRLIDIATRKVISFPGLGCEYVALSYVWGNVQQNSYKLGDTLKTLPRTLEDALSIAEKLGKSFIWIDSLCIDQADEQDKANQIIRMWSIYRGAWITLVALSGGSADAGFSRISRAEPYPQLVCHLKGKTIVSLMPTLSQQVWVSPWGSRAWTLQEGLLSPRCLYVSDHQIYFDCDSMQCSESLDDTRSWAHSLTPASNPTQEGFVTWMLRQAGAGALRIPLDWPSRRLEHWGEKLNLYSYRDMKHSEDAIRAFDGVLQRLESIYPAGFFWGLPKEDFDWALTWRSQVPPTRREGFPSWSWAGWKGPLFFGQPLDVKRTRRIPTMLNIWAFETARLTPIFTCNGRDTKDNTQISLVILHDPIHRASLPEIQGPELDVVEYSGSENNGHLFVGAVCLHFSPDFSNPRTGTYASGQNETFSFKVRGVQCLIRLFSTDSYIPGVWTGHEWVMDTEERKEDTFVLLARDHIQGFILHQLLLVKFQERPKFGPQVAERVTVLELLVPLDDLEILEEFKPRKEKFILR